jgi:hypothetical protein
MNSHMQHALTVLIASAFCATAYGHDINIERVNSLTAIKQLREQSASAQSISPEDIASCPPHSITVPSVVNGTLTLSSCHDDLLFETLREDTYSFTGFKGDTVTVELSSTAFDVFLWMPSTVSPTSVSFLTSGVSKMRIVYVFPQTTTYYIEAESLFSITDPQPTTGPYTLSISVNGSSGQGTCIPDSRSACLLQNRFRASVRYRGAFDNASADADASLKSVTGFAASTYETAFFYFNNNNNIELMLKVLDQGNTDSLGHPTIAVLFGSATPLRTEVTITDTKTGTVKKYTSQFGSQAGITDFAAFVK